MILDSRNSIFNSKSRFQASRLPFEVLRVNFRSVELIFYICTALLVQSWTLIFFVFSFFPGKTGKRKKISTFIVSCFSRKKWESEKNFKFLCFFVFSYFPGEKRGDNDWKIGKYNDSLYAVSTTVNMNGS